MRRWLVRAEIAFTYLLIVALAGWSAAALYFDFNFEHLRLTAAGLYVAVVLGLMFVVRRVLLRLLVVAICFAAVLVWWLGLKPSNSGNWQTDVAQTAYATVDGSAITFHNVRNCDYRAELDYTCQWLTRTVNLRDVRGVDLFMNTWGSPPFSELIAHTLVSFEIAPDANTKALSHLVFSIEARKQVGQTYSSLRGFFRQYTLISVVSEERDVVRLRTNYRQGEDLYLYHTKATPEFARSLLMDYVAATNALHDKPEWYNAVTRNCTTEIFTFKAMRARPLDWRILLNGKADAMLYDQGELATEMPAGSGPAPKSFAALKAMAHINAAAKAADKNPDFSARIRAGRPGFP